MVTAQESRKTVTKALRKLRAVDPTMATIIKRVGRCQLWEEERRSYFEVLVGAIIGQQVSAQAASAIRGRVFTALGTQQAARPRKLARMRVATLRKLGLSQAKASYVKGIAKAIESGTLNLDTLTDLSDEEIVGHLTALKGIGLWTAEMFMLFSLKRPDVFALGDWGLRRAAALAYGYSEPPNDNQLLAIAERWRPYRSVASWYLWRSL